jgi:hypothetical protein
MRTKHSCSSRTQNVAPPRLPRLPDVDILGLPGLQIRITREMVAVIASVLTSPVRPMSSPASVAEVSS